MSHADRFSALAVQTKPLARKHHACTACGESIAPGTKYNRFGVLDDGAWSTVKHCGRCTAIFNRLCAEQPQEPIAYDLDCGYSWRDTFGEDEPPDVAALAFMLPHESAVTS